MDYCSYHPLTAATYNCNHCHTHNCDRCVNEGDGRMDCQCFLCGHTVESLGTGNAVEPFWRRLQASFRYPINSHSLSLIIGVSVLTTILTFMPSMLIVGFIVYLALTGAMLKYCFRCLENTARGSMVAPDISEAYQGGIGLLFKLLGMIILLSLAVVGVGMVLGPGIAGLIAVFIVIGFPAMLINFAINEHFLEAINPINTLRLMTTIGLPYGLLIALLMVMMGSVGAIHQLLIGFEFSLISTVLQSMVSNYYMVVMFHIMGYMIFQYQAKLGFAAREDHGDDQRGRSEEEQRMAAIDVYLKEGEYDRVVQAFNSGIKKLPDSKRLHESYFEFLYRVKHQELMEDYATRYLQYALQQRYYDKLSVIYKQILEICPRYIPDNAELRFSVATTCKNKGDARMAVRLLNGIHKKYPGYHRLKDALQLMANALEEVPELATNAEKCRQLAEKIKVEPPEQSIGQATIKRKPASKTALQTNDSGEREKQPEPAHTETDLPPIDFK